MLHYFSKAKFGELHPHHPSERAGSPLLWPASESPQTSRVLASPLHSSCWQLPFLGPPALGQDTHGPQPWAQLPLHTALHPHPHPTPIALCSGTYQGKKRVEDCLHPHSAQNKATMPTLIKNGDFLSCHEFMPAPSPPQGRRSRKEAIRAKGAHSLWIPCLPWEGQERHRLM